MSFWRRLFGGAPAPGREGGAGAWLPQLRAQVFRDTYGPLGVVDEEAVVSRPLAQGLVEALVVSVPGGERTLSRAEARGSGRGDDALFALGRAQAVAAERGAGQVQEVPAAGALAFVSEGFYLSASMLEMLARHQAGEAGVVVAPVSWHHWVMHEVQPGVTSRALLEAFGGFVRDLAAGIEVSDAELLGDQAFWWRGGAWTPLPIEGAGEALRVRPPDALARLLAP